MVGEYRSWTSEERDEEEEGKEDDDDNNNEVESTLSYNMKYRRCAIEQF